MSENDRRRPFSERNGFAQPPALQINSMSDELRTCLWNALCRNVSSIAVFFDGDWRGRTFVQG